MTEIENSYNFLGGRFVTPFAEIQRKMDSIRAFVFDWDGVFNDGNKQSTGGSMFSEVDSMGTNLLRFSYFYKNEAMPITAILSGEKNDTAFYFSEREGFHYSFYKVPHKVEALRFLCEKENIKPENVAYFFDDILDIPIAELCGIRVLVNQKINPLFLRYCIKNNLVDYLTSASGGQFAVREATELLIGINGNFEETVNGRIRNSEKYQEYIKRRRSTKTAFYTQKEMSILAADPRS